MYGRIVLLVTITLVATPWATAAPQPEMEKVPYLGIATTQTLPKRREAIALPEGVGLTVQHVLPGSPGEGAGLRPGDVLHKLNDQVLVNNPQFRVLVRTFKPGDEIKLTVLRDAGLVEVRIRLGEKAVPVLAAGNGRYYWTLRTVEGKVDIVAVPATFSARYEDEQYVCELNTGADGKRFLAKDKEQGKILFHGPVDTPAEREAVPAGLRARLRLLETPPAVKSPLPSAGTPSSPASS